MFIGLHAMLAMQTNTPELMVSEPEGAAFMNAAQNFMRHYGVTSTQKVIDGLAFFGAGIGIYGTRFVAISQRHKAEGDGRPARTGSRERVVPIRPGVVTQPAPLDIQVDMSAGDHSDDAA